MYRVAFRLPWMKTRGDQLPNYIAPQIITPGVKPEWRRSANCKVLYVSWQATVHQIAIGKIEILMIWCYSLTQCFLSLHHSSLATRCSGVKGSRTIGRYDAKPQAMWTDSAINCSHLSFQNSPPSNLHRLSCLKRVNWTQLPKTPFFTFIRNSWPTTTFSTFLSLRWTKPFMQEWL
jgi:hypothetical protein